MKRIVLATFGSLGDLNPYVAIALELRRRGQRPLIVTSDIHREAVESAGIELAPMRPSAAQLGDPAELVLQRHVRGRDDPNIHRDGAPASQGLHDPLLKGPEQLRLSDQRKVDDLVEEKASAVCQLEEPQLSLVCPGKGPLLVPEELRLDERFG